jgi:acetylglutamate kinase
MMAPLASQCRDGSEHAGGPLNINGDTVAGELAHALGAERLIFLTDVPGIMDGNSRVLPRLDRRRAGILLRSDVVKGGMIPKLEACLRALERSPVADIIDGRQPGALLDCVKGRSSGTRIVAETSGYALGYRGEVPPPSGSQSRSPSPADDTPPHTSGPG